MVLVLGTLFGGTNGTFPLHGTERYVSVHFWGIYHFVQYLVSGTQLVSVPRLRF